jgi:formamidopyrimidine-DNA glycosylase
MPEFAEVEFYRKRWQFAAAHDRVVSVEVHPEARIFRGMDARELSQGLTGRHLVSSDAAAKQMIFHFSGGYWLGIHLGMTGDLRAEPADYQATRHDHLVIRTPKHALVLNDARMFGRVQFAHQEKPPTWWTRIAPPILSASFTAAAVAAFLQRRRRTAIKAVLLMQERFPGIGNWMADEILWRAGIHPKRSAGSLSASEIQALWKECRHVCRLALDAIAGKGRALPRDLNVNIPETWLFHHRWRTGGHCPLTGVRLVREEIGGRMTCWSPARQKLAVER